MDRYRGERSGQSWGQQQESLYTNSNIDNRNDETFGEGATTDDWETTHFALVETEGTLHHDNVIGGEPPWVADEPLHRDDVVRGESPRVADEASHRDDVVRGKSPQVADEALHYDDAIISAVPNEEWRGDFDIEEVVPTIAKMKIKELWPSSPSQSSTLDSIWSSPELPSAQDNRPPSSHLPPGTKVLTLEDLERELTSSPPRSHLPPSQHTPPPHPHIHQHRPNAPSPPPILRMAPPVHVRMPPPGLAGHPAMLPWLPPLPPPHLPMLPPHLLFSRGPPPHPHSHPHPPQGISTLPPPHHLPSHAPPPHAHMPPPPLHYHPHPHLHPHHIHGPPNPQPVRKSRRSELLNELKRDGSGFMTQKEKEWVIKIQLLQLQSSDPSTEDYYYQNYMQRKLAQDSPSRSSPQSQMLALPQVSREERSYKPVEFEKTLGKVSMSSVSAPRKTIEAPVSTHEGEKTKDSFQRKKQVLLTIEKIYMLALSLEDLERKALALPEEDRTQALAKKDSLCDQIFHQFRLRGISEPWEKNEDQLFQLMMNYRKGKKVVKRVLPLLSDAHAQSVVLALLRNISTVIKKDGTDQVLPELVLGVCAVIGGLEMVTVNQFLAAPVELQTTASLMKMAQNEFGASVLLALVRRGKEMTASKGTSGSERWAELTKRLYIVLLSHSEQVSSVKSADTLLHTLTSLTHLRELNI